MAKVVSFGELLVDMVSDADVGLAAAPRFLKAPGGAPANVAVGLQRLGIEARFVGQVGADPFGDWLKEVIARENVDTDFLLQTDLARTTIAFVATRADGKKDICFYRNPGADALLSPELIDEKLFEGARIFHCGSISLSENPARAAQFKAAHLARELGVLVSFDPNWRPSIWRDHSAARDLIWQMMRLSDIVKVADEEWEFVTGETNLEKGAQRILEAGPKLVVVTRGAAGAYFSCKNCDGEIVSGEAAGFSVDAIDTLGAGDAFVAGLLFRLLEYSRLEDALTLSGLQNALRFANACGALATMECGAIPALPTKMQAETFLRKAHDEREIS
jgi:fructokinase